MMTVTATQFKAQCLGLVERVRRTRKPVLITKRGRIVAQLAPPPEDTGEAWRHLRGSVTHMGDVVSPVVRKVEIDALR